MKYLLAALLVLGLAGSAHAACWWNGYQRVCEPYYAPEWQPYQWHEPDFWRWHHEHRDEHRDHRERR